jgi:hypothetical protein
MNQQQALGQAPDSLRSSCGSREPVEGARSLVLMLLRKDEVPDVQQHFPLVLRSGEVEAPHKSLDLVLS